MNYSIEQLPNGRWGIYAELKLLATIGCYQTGQKILALLQKDKGVKTRYQQLPNFKNGTSSTNQAA